MIAITNYLKQTNYYSNQIIIEMLLNCGLIFIATKKIPFMQGDSLRFLAL